MNHAATRYLEAKRSVDGRALAPRVRDRLLDALPPEPTVFEAGCGTGTTVDRLHGWSVRPASYRGVDRDPGVVAFARDVRPAALRRAGYDAVDTERGCTVDGRPIAFETGDALDAMRALGADPDADGVDLVVAQAFADLVPIGDLLDAVESALAPGGLAYCPITFDGGTVFQPDHPADGAVIDAYHAAIDAESGRDVHAGRHLLDLCRRRDGDLLAAAASDWIVRPRDGGYPADERYFLNCILGFVADALADADVEGGEDWVETRRDQLAAGELTYVAHGYDLLYRAPD